MLISAIQTTTSHALFALVVAIPIAPANDAPCVAAHCAIEHLRVLFRCSALVALRWLFAMVALATTDLLLSI